MGYTSTTAKKFQRLFHRNGCLAFLAFLRMMCTKQPQQDFLNMGQESSKGDKFNICKLIYIWIVAITNNLNACCQGCKANITPVKSNRMELKIKLHQRRTS